MAAALMALPPGFAVAEDLIVEHNPADTTRFSSVQAALDHAQNILNNPINANKSFRVVVKGDGIPYTGPIQAISNVPIVGTETARTILSGSGSAPIISIGSDVSNVTIRNLTFQNATLAVSVGSATSIEIRNNIFKVGTGGVAVQVQGSVSTSVINNTFYRNGTAISASADILITNNIFSGNSAAIAGGGVPLTRVSYNDFHNNAGNAVTPEAHSLPNSAALDPDPLFVDPSRNDFHLRAGSPAHAYGGGAAGNPSYPDAGAAQSFDMGAYGGPQRDTVPAQVSDLGSVTTSPSSLLLSWRADRSYQVSGYRLYYGAASGVYTGTDAAQGPSPVTVPQDTGRDTITAPLSGLAPLNVTPGTPVLTGVAPRDRALLVSWSPAAGATGYKIYYGREPLNGNSLAGVPFVVAYGGATGSILVPGLQNGVSYHVAVAAVSQREIFVAVTAVNNAAGPFDAGADNESAFSQELRLPVGEARESGLSNSLSDFPEAVAPYPDLRNEGCFIATAAYGCYSAPQVQALRDFRDRYLLTSAPGRAFVAWYYRHGPRGARFLNAHPWLKPVVRLLLLPLVGMAMFFVCLPPLPRVALLLIAALFLHRAVLPPGRVRVIDTGEPR